MLNIDPHITFLCAPILALGLTIGIYNVFGGDGVVMFSVVVAWLLVRLLVKI